MEYRYQNLILRDYQVSDIDDDIYWNSGHHPWMDWDAPWEDCKDVSDRERFRAEALAFIAAEKSVPRWQLQIEAEGVRIGLKSASASRSGAKYFTSSSRIGHFIKRY